MTQPDDTDLLRCFLDHRDDAAFAELVRRHGPLVLGVCHRIVGNAADAEDAGQAVFMTLAARAASLRRHRCLVGWLHEVARHVALHLREAELRRRRRERAVGTGAAQRALRAEDDAVLREAMDAAIADLPERYRLPLLLHHVSGCDYREVAERLGLRIDTVGARLTRARERLRPLLARSGVTIPSATVASLLMASRAGAAPEGFVAIASAAGGAVAAGSAITAPAHVVEAVDSIRRLLWLARLRLASLSAAVVSAPLALAVTAHLAMAGEAPAQPPVELDRSGGSPAAPQGDPAPSLADGSIRMFGGGGRFIAQGGVGNIAISPDGRHAACASAEMRGTGLIVWSVPAGSTTAVLMRDREIADCCWLDDRRLAALVGAKHQDPGGIVVVDAESGFAPITFAPAQPAIACACRIDVAPDGATIIATAGGNKDYTVQAWKAATGERLEGIADAHVVDNVYGVYVARFSPDGRRVACSDLEGVTIWDWPTRRETGRWRIPAECEVASVPIDMRWDPSGTKLRFLGNARHDGHVATLEFAVADGALVGEVAGLAVYGARDRMIGSLRHDGTFTYADGPRAGQSIRFSGVPAGPYCRVVSGAASPDGSLLLARWMGGPGQDAQAPMALDLPNARQLAPAAAMPTRAARCLAMVDDGRLLSSDGIGLSLWDIATGEQVAKAAPMPAFSSLVTLSIPTFGLVATAGGTGKGVQLWDASTLKPAGELEAHAQGGWYNWIDRMYADGPLLATVNDYGSVRFHDLRTLRSLAEISCSREADDRSSTTGSKLAGMRALADGSLAYISDEGFSKQALLTGAWDPRTGERRLTFRFADGSCVSRANLEIDQVGGRCFLVGANPADNGIDRSVSGTRSSSGLWDSTSGSFVRELSIAGSELRLNAGRDLLIGSSTGCTTSDAPVGLHTLFFATDVASGERIPDRGVWPDGTTVLSEDGDVIAAVDGGRLRVVDVRSGALLAARQLGIGESKAVCLALDRDASHAAIALADMRFAVVDLFPQPQAAPGSTPTALAERLESADAAAALAALSGLVALGAAAVPVLAEAATSMKPVSVRRALHALEWLARRGSASAKQALATRSEARDSDGGRFARAALRRLAPRPARHQSGLGAAAGGF